MAPLKATLEKLIAELKGHPCIELQEGFLGDGLRDAEIDEIAGSQSVRVAKSIQQFYRAVNGVSIIWQLSSRAGKRIRYLPGDEDTNVLGTITFTLLEDLVLRSSSVRGPVWEDPVSEKGRRQLRAFRAFDRNVEEERVGLMCINGTLNDELFYLRQGNKSVFNIKANLNRYLRALKQSRGFCGWQNDFALRPSGLKTSAMIHYISQLFPRERFSEFKR